MAEWTYRCMIVQAALAPLARSLAAGIAGESGTGMWQTQLSATGQEPATHYISAGLIWPQFAALLQDPQGIVSASGGAVSSVQAQALVDGSIVSTEQADQVLASSGLQIISVSSITG